MDWSYSIVGAVGHAQCENRGPFTAAAPRVVSLQESVGAETPRPQTPETQRTTRAV